MIRRIANDRAWERRRLGLQRPQPPVATGSNPGSEVSEWPPHRRQLRYAQTLMNAGFQAQQHHAGGSGGRAVAGSNPVSPITESPGSAGASCLPGRCGSAHGVQFGVHARPGVLAALGRLRGRWSRVVARGLFEPRAPAHEPRLTAPSHFPGDLAAELQHDSHAPVPGVRHLAEHARAPSGDH